MKNFPLKDEKGNTWWVSRSVAVVGFVFTVKDDTLYILANKRGKGTPDFQGCWNVPCGYLDYDENGQEACSREIFEETGVEINPRNLRLIFVNTDPKDSNRQNVSLRYQTSILNGLDLELSTINMEQDEVEDVRWIPIKELSEYKWAFNHDRLILDALRKVPVSVTNFK